MPSNLAVASINKRSCTGDEMTTGYTAGDWRLAQLKGVSLVLKCTKKPNNNLIHIFFVFPLFPLRGFTIGQHLKVKALREQGKEAVQGLGVARAIGQDIKSMHQLKEW